MCETIDKVARDGWATCSKCGGQDAYKKSQDRPRLNEKQTVGEMILKECERLVAGVDKTENLVEVEINLSWDVLYNRVRSTAKVDCATSPQ